MLVVVGVTFVGWDIRRSFPQTSGSLALAGLKANVDVLRDERGIAHIYADTPEDLFFAEGFTHAQDRFWEMDFRRHITSGRLSEMFGKTQIETDTFLRTSGWRRVAEKELALLSPETRRNLDAYSRGVNAYLADHSGATASFEYVVLGLQNSSYQIEPWTPVDSVSWLKAMAWDLRGNMADEIARSVISDKIGRARTATLYPEYPYLRHCPIVMQGGVVDGVWEVPGIVIGHNQTIGWGFTNLGPDVTDLYLEKITGDSYLVGTTLKPVTTRTETIRVAGGADVTIVVRETEHGPIVSDASTSIADLGQVAPNGVIAPPRGDGYAVALRWTALTPGRTMDAVTALNTAQTWEEFRTAASLFEVPAQNLVFASVDGTIGYQTPGRIPVRTGYDGKYPALGWDPRQTWSGYIPFDALPHVKNPDDGWIVTANQASVYKEYPYFITDDWSYGARSQRIVDRVTLATTGGNKITAEEMRDIQFDSWNENAAYLVPKIAGIPKDGATAQAAAHFGEWDFRQPADSAAAAYFNAFWKNLLLDTFGSQLPADHQPDGGDRWFTIVRNLCERAPLDDPWWDDARTPQKENREQAVVKALNEATAEMTSLQGSDPNAWRWGEMHTLLIRNQTLGKSGIKPIEAIFNRGPIAPSGGDSIVSATGWTVPEGYGTCSVKEGSGCVDL